MADHGYAMVVTKIAEADGGGYLAIAPDLRGCMGDGATPEQAVADLGDAISEWIDEARRLGRPIPAPGAIVEKVAQNRAALMNILREQDRMLSNQEQRIASVSGQLENLKREIVEVLERQERLESETAWGALAVLTAAGPRRIEDRSH